MAVDSFRRLDRCLCCGGDLSLVLDMGEQPLANSYLEHASQEEQAFPLVLLGCGGCRHMQLGHAVDPNLLFRNYLYVSGTTETLKGYFRWFAGMVRDRLPGARSVLEVACNDGSQLDSFADAGFETFGVDPAENLHPLSSRRHRVACGYLDRVSLERLPRREYDVVVAQNVLAHTADPHGMLEDICSVMHSGTLLFVQTSQADMAQMGQFDTVYHEHVSFFCVNSMRRLMERSGLHLVDVVKTPIHGGSLVFVASRSGGGEGAGHAHNDIDEFEARSPGRLSDFARRALGSVEMLRAEVEAARDAGFSIGGYGAAAKGNTVLNFGKIHLDFIVDDNPLKQGKLTPGMRIPIIAPASVEGHACKKIKWVILSWNFRAEIEGRISRFFGGFENGFIRMNFER